MSTLDSIRQKKDAKTALSRSDAILHKYKHLDRDMWLQNTVSLERVDILLDDGDHAAAMDEIQSCLRRGAYSPEDFTTLIIVYADVLACSGATGQGLSQLVSALRVLGDQNLGSKISILRTYRRLCLRHKADPGQEIVEVARSLAQSFDCLPAPGPCSDSSSMLQQLEYFITALTAYARSRTRAS